MAVLSQRSRGAGSRGPSEFASKLPSLTGLRFVAAFAVFLYHASLTFSPIPPYAPVTPFADAGLAKAIEGAFSKAGYVGVSFFFVLSGFVLTWSSKPGERARSFLRRRMFKIYPNHIVTWAVAMVLFAAAFTPTRHWLSNLFLLHAFTPDAYGWVSVNGPSWSLSSELLFYLLFPLLIIPIRRLADTKLFAWVVGVVAAMVGGALFNHFIVPGPETVVSPFPVPASPLQFWVGYFFPVGRLLEFVLGMLLARMVLAGRWRLRIGVVPAAALLVASYVVSLRLPYVFGFSVATVVPVALLIGAAATADVRGTATVLRSRPAQWLGEISFGFYMCQGIVLLYGRTVFGGVFSTPVAILVVLLFAVANLLAAWALYSLVERPIMRRWSRSRKRTVAPVPASAPAPSFAVSD